MFCYKTSRVFIRGNDRTLIKRLCNVFKHECRAVRLEKVPLDQRKPVILLLQADQNFIS